MHTMKAKPVTYLSAYAATRHYGGPEEGGWWYEQFHFLGYKTVVFSFDRWLAIRSNCYREKANPVESARAGMLRKYEALHEDDEIVVFAEEKPGQHATARRPHYC